MELETLLEILDSPVKNFQFVTPLEGKNQGEQLIFGDDRLLWPKERDTKPLEMIEDHSTGTLEYHGTFAFSEYFGQGPELVICGGGHVGAAVVRLAKLLGLPVTALEDRPEYAEQLRQAGADRVICAPFSEGLAEIKGGANVYFVVVTRAHAFDLDCLRPILQKPAAYVGMMGSKGRAALVRRQLLEGGADPEKVEDLHAPIGLPIGSQSAEEIALSILAEIVKLKNQRLLSEGYPPAILDGLRQAAAEKTSAVLAVIVSRSGSTPREVGSKMLVLPGRTVGSIGGGIMEYRAKQRAMEMLAGETAFRVDRYSADGKDEDATVAACGGSMAVLLQKLTPRKDA